MRLLILVVVWLLMASNVHAGTLMLGAGQQSCGRLIAAASVGVLPGKYIKMNTQQGEFFNEYKEYQEWLMGFISGFNAAHGDDINQQVGNIDLAGLDVWIRNWCNRNPTKLVFEGGNAFVDEMRTGAPTR